MYMLSPSDLAKVRAAIDDELEQIKRELEHEGLTYSPAALKTAPKGYAKDHPYIELLRRKSHVAMRHEPPQPWLHTAEAKERVAQTWRAVQPLCDWLDRATND